MSGAQHPLRSPPRPASRPRPSRPRPGRPTHPNPRRPWPRRPSLLRRPPSPPRSPPRQRPSPPRRRSPASPTAATGWRRSTDAAQVKRSAVRGSLPGCGQGDRIWRGSSPRSPLEPRRAPSPIGRGLG
ncbi:hypothetical protein MHIMP23_04765 [Methylobacterium hispanicum]